MNLKHSDRCWWRAFSQEVKRAFRRDDIELKARLYELYERHMNHRLTREYYYCKRLDYMEQKAKGLIDRRLGFYDWLEMNRP